MKYAVNNKTRSRKGFYGRYQFCFRGSSLVKPEEQNLIKKYKSNQEVLYTKGGRNYTVGDLTNTGVKEKCKDVSIVLNNEEVIKNGCKHLKVLLDVMNSFGGQEIFEYLKLKTKAGTVSMGLFNWFTKSSERSDSERSQLKAKQLALNCPIHLPAYAFDAKAQAGMEEGGYKRPGEWLYFGVCQNCQLFSDCPSKPAKQQFGL